MVSPASSTWRPDTLPPSASATAAIRWWVLPRSRASWSRAAARSPGLSNSSSPSARIWSAPITSASGLRGADGLAPWPRQRRRRRRRAMALPATAERVAHGALVDVGGHDLRSSAGGFQHAAPERAARGQGSGPAGLSHRSSPAGLGRRPSSPVMQQSNDGRGRLLHRAARDVDHGPAVAGAEPARIARSRR